MAKSQQPPGQVLGPESGESEHGPNRDTIYKMLANERRRYTIHYLKQVDGEVPLGMLAEYVGAWERDTEPEKLASDERKTVYTALQQRHLPKLDDAGLIQFDKRAGVVEPSETLTDIEIYAEVVPSGSFPWSQYYLGLSTVSVSLMVAVWAGAYPLAALPDIAWGIFISVAFTFSAIFHVIMTREMKLGTDSDPPIRQGDR